jgi:hypothetical protein
MIKYSGISNHIYYESGKAKTVCTSTVLGHLGISPGSYRYSGEEDQILAILRRHGYAVRSRMSRLEDSPSVGRSRTKIQRMRDPLGTMYLVIVKGHALLLNQEGRTVVDTDPRLRDSREILSIYAVFRR